MTEDQTVVEACTLMAQKQVGAVTVMGDGRIVGIFSERDILRRVIGAARSPEKTLLREVMTPDPVTAAVDEERLIAISKMQAVGCRHLPVVVGETVIDMLSMRDLLFVELEEKEEEVESLRRYIGGSY
ncbi:MAG: CBS domain-containing protein [bacterium]|nr:CBS domain-containing protein [bacterium]